MALTLPENIDADEDIRTVCSDPQTKETTVNISLMTRDPSRPTSNNKQLRYSPDDYL